MTGLDYNAMRRLLGKKHQSNIKHATEDALRKWMDEAGTLPVSKLENEEQLELELSTRILDAAPTKPSLTTVDPYEDLKPTDTRTPCGQIAGDVMVEVDRILPLSPQKRAHVLSRVINAVETGMESQAQAASELIGKLEDELGDKDEQIKAFQLAGTSQFQLGKDVGQMGDHERGALQALLNKTETENVHLRATVKSLSQTL